jgi:hypothetical protein
VKEREPVRETLERARSVVDFSSAMMEPMVVLITMSAYLSKPQRRRGRQERSQEFFASAVSCVSHSKDDLHRL